MKRGPRVLFTILMVPAVGALLLGCPKKITKTDATPQPRVSELVGVTRPTPPPTSAGDGAAARQPTDRQTEEQRTAQLLASRGEDIPIKESPTIEFVEPSPEDKAILKPIYFEYNKSNIRPEYQPVLENISKWLAKKAGQPTARRRPLRRARHGRVQPGPGRAAGARGAALPGRPRRLGRPRAHDQLRRGEAGGARKRRGRLVEEQARRVQGFRAVAPGRSVMPLSRAVRSGWLARLARRGAAVVCGAALAAPPRLRGGGPHRPPGCRESPDECPADGVEPPGAPGRRLRTDPRVARGAEPPGAPPRGERPAGQGRSACRSTACARAPRRSSTPATSSSATAPWPRPSSSPVWAPASTACRRTSRRASRRSTTISSP